MNRRHPRQGQPFSRIVANHQIRFPQVRVLSEQGEMLGVMSSRDAFYQAKDQEKDLVLVTEKAEPPIVKIIDLAKHKYQLKQKKAEGRKNSKKQDIKGVRLTPFIGEGDFQVRLKKILAFLEEGHKVRIEIPFTKGRQITKKDFGYKNFDRIFAAIQEIGEIEIEPKMIGKKMMAQLMPKKKTKPTEKVVENQS